MRSQLSSPSASPAGVVWLPSSELGHIVFSSGASVMTCRHQEKFQVTLCYTLIPLPQVLNFYLKYRKVGKCAGSGVWHWLVTTGKSSNISESQFLRCEAGTIVFSLKDVVQVELLFICLVAQGKPSISGSSALCIPAGSPLSPAQTGVRLQLIQWWLPPGISLPTVLFLIKLLAYLEHRYLIYSSQQSCRIGIIVIPVYRRQNCPSERLISRTGSDNL